MELFEKTIKSNLIYDGKILQLYKDEIETAQGHKSTREIINHNGGASVLAIDDENNIYLVEQFRYAYKEVVLEIPAGKIEKGEDPYNTAVRELSEEIGATAKEIKKLGLFYPTPGYTNEPLYVYLAKGLTKIPKVVVFITLVKMPFSEALSKVMNNEIKDAKTVISILMNTQFSQ